jgi:hypothetical protein
MYEFIYKMLIFTVCGDRGEYLEREGIDRDESECVCMCVREADR